MEPIKRILVGLDTTEMNATVLSFASFIVESSSAEEIFFVNIIKNFNIPEEVKKEFPDLEKNALQERRDMLEDLVAKTFSPSKKVKVDFIIKLGQPAKSILNLASKLSIDLIVMGRKRTIDGTGVLVPRLARRASCNLLVVPEGAAPRSEKVLVPIDFSDHAMLALQQAIDIASKTNKNMEIICQNVYNVPVGYHYTGKSFKDFSLVMKKNAQKNFQKFIQKIDTKGLKITEVYSQDKNDNLASDINDLANEINPDTIIFGAKGRTATTALFIGSLAEKLITAEMPYPILVVRPKGKAAGIIDYIKEL